MQRFKKVIKRIGIDAAGYGLIIAGLLTGWLPGPGGIPLILGGLGLLAIHNHWARRVLHFIQENGSKFVRYIFPEKPLVKALHDIFAVAMVVSALFLAIKHVSYAAIGVAIALFFIGIADFLYNRKRWERFKRRD